MRAPAHEKADQRSRDEDRLGGRELLRGLDVHKACRDGRDHQSIQQHRSHEGGAADAKRHHGYHHRGPRRPQLTRQQHDAYDQDTQDEDEPAVHQSIHEPLAGLLAQQACEVLRGTLGVVRQQ
jgi:hypothetical protein